MAQTPPTCRSTASRQWTWVAVRGIAVKGLAGTAGYLYLQSIEISSKKPPEARVEFEQKLAGGNIKRVVRKLSKGDNLYDLSNQLDQYRDGYVVSDIQAPEVSK